MIKTILVILGMVVLAGQSEAQFLKNYYFNSQFSAVGDYKIGIVRHGTNQVLNQVSPNRLEVCLGWRSFIPATGEIAAATGGFGNCITTLNTTLFDFVYKPSVGGQWQVTGKSFSLADVYGEN